MTPQRRRVAERVRVESPAVDRLFERARSDNDTATLEALGVLSRELRELKTLNTKAADSLERAVVATPPSTADTAFFHQIHTKALPFSNALSQVLCAVFIELSNATLWRSEAAVEGATFLLYNLVAYTLPALVIVFAFPDRMAKSVKVTLFWIGCSLAVMMGLIAHFWR